MTKTAGDSFLLNGLRTEEGSLCNGDFVTSRDQTDRMFKKSCQHGEDKLYPGYKCRRKVKERLNPGVTFLDWLCW